MKRAVEEYMAEREAKNKDDDVSTKPNNKGFKKNPQRQENRLSGLLNKIRTRNNNIAPKQKSIKRLQIKWHRYDDNSYQLVRVNQGGGCRFVEVDEDSTFNDIKSKATDLFFDDSFKNSYGENVLECTISICDASLNELDEALNLFSYVRKKGFQLSKTFFVLKSEYNDSNTNENEILCDNSVSSKRRICLTCGGTYIKDCLTCIQNDEYNESLSNDRIKRDQSYHEAIFDSYNLFDDLPVLSEVTNNEPAESATTPITSTVQDSNDEEHLVSPEQLRVLRVEHFGKKQHIIRIHRMKVVSDLVKYFIENKVRYSIYIYFIVYLAWTLFYFVDKSTMIIYHCMHTCHYETLFCNS